MVSTDTKVNTLIINTMTQEIFDSITPSDTELYLVTDGVLEASDITDALGYIPYDSSNPSGYITGITSSMITSALGYTPYDSSNPDGYITGITSTDVTTALGYTPYNSTNPDGFISSASVSTLTDTTLSNLANGQALLYNSTSGKWENKNIVTSVSWGGITGTLADQTDLQNALNEKTTMAAVEAKGYITGITSSMITTALGYTPYDSSNPSGYITGITSNMVTSALGYTPYDSSNPSGYITGITSGMVTVALGYTPEDSANIVTTISSVSTDSTYPSAKAVYNAIQASAGATALAGLSDVDITSPAQGENLTYDATTGKWQNTLSTSTVAWGGITGTLADQTDLQDALDAKTTMSAVEAKGYITGITSSMVTTALGFTPYDSSNPSGFITGITSGMITTALGFTPYSDANPNGYQANVLETVKVNGTAMTPTNKAISITVPTSTTQLTNDSGFITSTAITNMQTTTNLVTTISSVSTDSTYPSAKCVYDAIQAGSGSTSLDGLSDVDITSPLTGQNLTYDATTGKWKNTSTSATVAWGGITGTLSDQTDLQNALSSKTSKFSTVNPALTSSSGTCTWSITNEIGSKKVQVTIYDTSTYKEVVADVSATDSTISIELISDSNILANTYEAVIVG